MIIRSWIIRHNIRSGFILRLRHPIAHFSDGNAIQLWHRTTPKRCMNEAWSESNTLIILWIVV
jgi:hypothetical protein